MPGRRRPGHAKQHECRNRNCSANIRASLGSDPRRLRPAGTRRARCDWPAHRRHRLGQGIPGPWSSRIRPKVTLRANCRARQGGLESCAWHCRLRRDYAESCGGRIEPGRGRNRRTLRMQDRLDADRGRGKRNRRFAGRRPQEAAVLGRNSAGAGGYGHLAAENDSSRSRRADFRRHPHLSRVDRKA